MDIRDSRTGKTFINSVASMLVYVGYILLTFAMRSVFIYTLGEQYTGVAGVFSSVLNMLSFSELGISSAVSASLYRPLREKDHAYIRRLMLFYKRAYTYIALFIIMAGIALVPFLNGLIKGVPDIWEDIRIIFLFYIAKTASSYLLIYKETLLIADQRQYISKRIEMLWLFLRYGSEMLCLVIWKQYLAFLVIELTATILQNYTVSRKVSHIYPEVFQASVSSSLSKEERNGLFKDIKALSMYKIASKINNSVDNVLISSVINTVTVTYFSNYTLIASQLQSVILQFSSAATPSVGSLAAEGDRRKQSAAFWRLFYLIFLMVNFCAVSFLVLIAPFVTLWLGESFLLSGWVAFAIAFDLFLSLLTQEATVFRTANRLFVLGQYQAVASTLLNIALSLLFITRFHIFGAVLATIIARLLTHWFEPYLLLKNVLHEPFLRFYCRYWWYILLFLSSAALTWFLAGLIQPESLYLTLILRAVCCVAVPNAWVLLFTFRTAEFRYVMDLSKAVLAKLCGGKASI